ncbi:hypothetical protein GS636_06710 [Ruegeria sp. HKCCD4884]|uniref:hypothetical protein n=1 Tax=Ruegeria sp. HKCCD4884 TaxID=2683022 RepID=UPI0014912D48|nr:hypothetical protein [Ruegeria sp. HKCCD4884]NOD92472.1 hypothetical protein [Ruegeria sp. HKCCD4884]
MGKAATNKDILDRLDQIERAFGKKPDDVPQAEQDAKEFDNLIEGYLVRDDPTPADPYRASKWTI